ncbi:GldL-related protein [Marinoscillum sp.]|uniref:GldL-related protein n=1 Tax=Marinoscillum sp. TaxID=2024838 RepID=UPI003BAC1643
MITDEQVDFIEKQIVAADVKSKSLRDDLLDHMCCLIEMETKKGLSFDQAYQKAFLQTSPNGYGEIQNETLFLLNYNKIMNMKRMTYISGFIFSVTLSVGALFKILHWPGANLQLMIGTFGLAFIFVPLILINKYKSLVQEVLSERMKWIFGILSLLLFLASSLFKLNHLMGANILLMSSFLIFGFGYLPFLFFRMYKSSVEEM